MTLVFIGLFLLILLALMPFIGLLFPLFMFIPLVFMFRKPTVRVYTRSFGDDPFTGQNRNTRRELPRQGEDSDIVDVEFTEKETRNEID